MTTTELILTPGDIVTDFLRSKLTDPRGRISTSSTTFYASAGQTTKTVTPPSGSVSCITSITVAGASQTKWKDYYWDYQNQNVIFETALTGGETVIINYRYGSTDWIYGDRPDQSIGASSFPRVSVWAVSGTGKRLGNYSATFETMVNLQIDVWTRDGQVFTISDRKYSNEYLSEYIAIKITQAFEDNENDLFPAMYDYDLPGASRDGPYSEEYNAFHRIIEITLKSLDTGRVSITN